MEDIYTKGDQAEGGGDWRRKGHLEFSLSRSINLDLPCVGRKQHSDLRRSNDPLQHLQRIEVQCSFHRQDAVKLIVRTLVW